MLELYFFCRVSLKCLRFFSRCSVLTTTFTAGMELGWTFEPRQLELILRRGNSYLVRLYLLCRNSVAFAELRHYWLVVRSSHMSLRCHFDLPHSTAFHPWTVFFFFNQDFEFSILFSAANWCCRCSEYFAWTLPSSTSFTTNDVAY